MKFTIEPSNTYKTEERANKAVWMKGFNDLRYFIMKTEDGRYFPVFVGMPAIEAGVHFHFNVIG